jgi:gamma-glutamylcyclotransferase (GGCT)/AIG2-like uncharacterized protein YtfP
MNQLSVKVFVYGTLKPGHGAYQRFCAQMTHDVQAAIVYGSLYHLPLGYPALISGSQIIRGYLLSFADSNILERLDDYENHDPAEIATRYPGVAIEQVSYERLQIAVLTPECESLGQAWAYLMTAEKIKLLAGVLVKDGNWQGCLI